MRWLLNTTKPCTVSELGPHLLAELEHFCDTQPAGIARQAVPDYILTEKDRNNPEDPNIARIKRAIEAERAPILAEARETLKPVSEQIKAAISAAVSVAKGMIEGTALYQVTLAGHFDTNRKDGIDERINISVDVAPGEG